MSKITNTSAVHDNGAAKLQIGINEDQILVKRKGEAVEIVDKDGNKLPIDGASGVYVGEEKIPEGYNVKINPKGSVLRIPSKMSDLEDDCGYISESEKGVAEGIATLGADGKVPESQLPTIDANGAHVGAEPPANTKMVWVDTEDESVGDANTIMHTWYGTVLEITSDAGTSSADLVGPAGYTPEKGVDYYTENDKQELIAELTSRNPVPEQINEHNTNNTAHSDIRELISFLPTKKYVDDAIGTIPTPDVSGQINTHNVATDAHADIRELIGSLPTKTYVDDAISQIPTPDVSGQINAHNTATEAHNDIRELLRNLSTKINNFLDVDDETSDQLSEVLTLIDNNKGTLESLTNGKVNVSDIIDNLTTNNSNKVLSAAQGVALKALIDALDSSKATKSELTTLSTQVTELNNQLNLLMSSAVAVLSGSAEPQSTLGEDGDIYLMT